MSQRRNLERLFVEYGAIAASARRARDVPMDRQRRRREFVSGELRENADGTYDLIGVEILATGGPVHGIGSPPEGDYWSLEELRDMAAADLALGDELLPPNKIGHPDEQTLVQNSIDAGEIPEPTDGEMPAVGWLENLRVDGDRLLTDIKQVPKVVALAIQKGAYRTRSVELSRVTSQVTGKTYEWVVTGLAWLGGVMPAVRTLGDVVALYAGDVPIRRRFTTDGRDYADTAAIIWEPEAGFGDLQDDLQHALNPNPGPNEYEARFWVSDVAISLDRCIVNDYASGETWIVPFTMGDDGDPVVAPAADWILAERAWVEAARDMEARLLTLRTAAADTRAKMRYSASQIRKFAKATGLDADKVTAKMLEDAGVTPTTESDADETETDAETEVDETEETDGDDETEDEDEESDEADGETPPARSNAARIKALETQLHQADRREFVTKAISDKKIAPGQRKSLQAFYDQDPDGARKFVKDLPKRDDLEGELGADDGETRDFEAVHGVSYEDNAAARLSIPKDQIR